MFDRLEDLLIRFEEIMSELNEPFVVNDQTRFQKLMKEQSDLQPIVDAYKEYKDNKDIVFMGISVDASKNIQKWKDFVIKEQTPRVQLFGGDMAGPTLSKPYKITGIPRFMLVGKDGSLIYMDAPRPSSSEIRAVLNDALKK